MAFGLGLGIVCRRRYTSNRIEPRCGQSNHRPSFSARFGITFQLYRQFLGFIPAFFLALRSCWSQLNVLARRGISALAH